MKANGEKQLKELEMVALKELAKGFWAREGASRRRLPGQNTSGESTNGVPTGRAEQIRVSSPAHMQYGH